jgi:hypothetical protein
MRRARFQPRQATMPARKMHYYPTEFREKHIQSFHTSFKVPFHVNLHINPAYILQIGQELLPLAEFFIKFYIISLPIKIL